MQTQKDIRNWGKEEARSYILVIIWAGNVAHKLRVNSVLTDDWSWVACIYVRHLITACIYISKFMRYNISFLSLSVLAQM